MEILQEIPQTAYKICDTENKCKQHSCVLRVANCVLTF